VLFTENSL
jgi:hypothetical protein